MSPSVFDPGLESITVAETELCDVDGAAGELVVRGYRIEDLAARASYEEAVYLLLNGQLPTETQLASFREELASRRGISDSVRALLGAAADDGQGPMDALRMGVAAAELGNSVEDDDAARRLVAVLPTIVATYWRYRQGEEPIAPDPELSHAANYQYMLTGEVPTDAECRALETFLTTTVEHGLNPSTFTARTVVSTESDMVSAVTAAVGALKGRRHGGNLDGVFDVLRSAHGADDIEAAVEQSLDGGGRLPGFGHRVYQVRDPRAAVLSAATERLAASTDAEQFLSTVRELEAAGIELLARRRPDQPAAPTVEYYATALLSGVGVPPPLFTPTFAVSRVGGWTAHCREQRANNELVRPVGRYVGERNRTWTPLRSRTADGESTAPELERLSETLSTLAQPARLDILLALADAEGPVEYSTLQSLTGIEDKGRFNYHLRKLRGTFVRDGESGYELSPAGAAVVEDIAAGGWLPREE